MLLTVCRLQQICEHEWNRHQWGGHRKYRRRTGSLIRSLESVVAQSHMGTNLNVQARFDAR